jgi:hypothetical protein
MLPFTSHITFEFITKSWKGQTQCDNMTLNGQIIIINKKIILLHFYVIASENTQSTSTHRHTHNSKNLH